VNDDFITRLYTAGLLQFGRFDGVPFRHNLHMLPSYPQILHDLTEATAQLMDFSGYDHLLCPLDSLPFAMSLSQHLTIPLVYSQGSEQPPARDLVGAYDVGHPAVLVVDAWRNAASLHNLIADAGRVGLNVGAVVAMLDQSVEAAPVPVQALLHLQAVTDVLVERGTLPGGQSIAVKKWLQDDLHSK